MSTLPPTILSRCQRWLIHTDAGSALNTLGSSDPALSKLLTEQDLWIEQLNVLLKQQQSLTACAQYLASFELPAVLTFLYAFTLRILQNKISPEQQLSRLEFSLSEYVLLQQIEEINAIRRKINHTITVNPLLAIERIVSYYLLAHQDEQERL